MRTIRTPKRRGTFLTSIRAGSSVSVACEAPSLGRTTAYALRAGDAAFAAEWDDAAEVGVELLEDEARRRAMAHSDLLLIFLLKHHRPERYRLPRQLGISGIESAPPIRIEFADMADDDLRRELAELQNKERAAIDARALLPAMRRRSNGVAH